MYNKVIGRVFCTDDLEQFKVLGGNRMVKESHKQEIIRSLSSHGYIMNPIIVNDKMEVIDGQTRLAACKELHISVYYIVSPGIGIDECVVLNSSAKVWTLHDYVSSYAEQGNENYKRIRDLMQIGCMNRTTFFAVGIFGGTGRNELAIKEGAAVCTQDTFDKARAALQFLLKLKPVINRIPGRRAAIEVAIIFAYADVNCNNERLADAITKYYALLEGCVNETVAMGGRAERLQSESSRQKTAVLKRGLRAVQEGIRWTLCERGTSQRFGGCRKHVTSRSRNICGRITRRRSGA